jgi:hypothetical protein
MPPGDYAFSASAKTDESAGKVSSQWIMRCLGGPQTQFIWSSHNGPAVTIPQGCLSQLIQLIVTQEDSSRYGQLLVQRVAFARR